MKCLLVFILCVSTKSLNHWQLCMNRNNVSLCTGHVLIAVDGDLGVRLGIVDEVCSCRKTANIPAQSNTTYYR